MMNTPICDFVNKYCEKNALRFHMPAHKGKNVLGVEDKDITEINGADSLFEANGIIAESESNASLLFNSRTFYSTEGSSHCIRAMLYMVKMLGCKKVIATRNSHKTFLTALALLDIDVEWLFPSDDSHYLSSNIDALKLDESLSNQNGVKTVYITTPDYLGNITDVEEISKICKKHNAFLLVDNAHGAYLKFLKKSLHPIDLGADLCCDSAHKTLPVLTGGAYLHISNDTDTRFKQLAKNALSLFGSTSPSYLILQSLDMANAYLSNGYKDKLATFIDEVNTAKETLTKNGYTLSGNEDLKIVIKAKDYGYYGTEIASILEDNNVVCEFADKDYIVLMLSLENGVEALTKLVNTLSSIQKKVKINETAPILEIPKRAKSVRDAVFAESEVVDIKDSIGRISAQFNIPCPPAVPIVVCGEIISENVLKCFEYYNTETISVIK
ncbi:MAG: aminotransferase class V-fold PLP-dependent enzyme [Clostridia bacterium]|nr:aminotransferase class V-fold PLP-dependent enzyme [Clostridia bacterium]